MSENLNFRAFLSPPTDWEVYNTYHAGRSTVREISRTSGRSVGEVYRVLARCGGRPDRMAGNRHAVEGLAKSGLSVRHIAEITGYTPRNVRYILGSL